MPLPLYPRADARPASVPTGILSTEPSPMARSFHGGRPPTAEASGNDSDVVISSASQTLGGVDHGSVVANHGARCQMCFIDMRRPEDVHNAFACGEEVVRDDTPMAAPPDGLGAHDRASVPATSVSEPRQTRCERQRQRVVRIIAKASHPPISVESEGSALRIFPRRPPSFGDMLIADLPRRQRFGEAFAIEQNADWCAIVVSTLRR